MNVHLPIVGLPEEEITIGEFIKEHRPDYATAHFGKWHMGPKNPSVHGYDIHDGPTTNTEGRQNDPDPKRIQEVTRKSVDFLKDQAETEKPFLLIVSHYAVHTPVYAGAAYNEKYANLEPGTRHKDAAYAAMTENLDQSLSALLDTLENLELDDSTYFIYTSDNGGEFQQSGTPTSNAPLRKGKTHTWEGGIRVPLIVHGLGIAADTQCDAPVNGSDFFATIADLLEIDETPPDNQDGGSLENVLKNSGTGSINRPTEEFVWYYPRYRDFKGVYPQASIRLGKYKLRKEYDTETL